MSVLILYNIITILKILLCCVVIFSLVLYCSYHYISVMLLVCVLNVHLYFTTVSVFLQVAADFIITYLCVIYFVVNVILKCSLMDLKMASYLVCSGLSTTLISCKILRLIISIKWAYVATCLFWIWMFNYMMWAKAARIEISIYI